MLHGYSCRSKNQNTFKPCSSASLMTTAVCFSRFFPLLVLILSFNTYICYWHQWQYHSSYSMGPRTTIAVTVIALMQLFLCLFVLSFFGITEILSLCT